VVVGVTVGVIVGVIEGDGVCEGVGEGRGVGDGRGVEDPCDKKLPLALIILKGEKKSIFFLFTSKKLGILGILLFISFRNIL
jgi:hypothetical protein